MVTHTFNYETVDAAFAVDHHGVIVGWNSAAEKTLGYPASKALGKQCWKLLCGKDANNNKYCCAFCPLIDMALHHEPVNEFHASFKTGLAERKQYAVSCLTIFDEPGNEQLLHICRPEPEAEENDLSRATTIATAVEHCSSLSQREIEVLKLLSDGGSTRSIATIMGIKTSTVRIHIQHMMLKLDVHKRREAVKLGRKLDLI